MLFDSTAHIPFCDAEHQDWAYAGGMSLYDQCVLLIPPADPPVNDLGYADRGHPDTWYRQGPYACGLTLAEHRSGGRLRLVRGIEILDETRVLVTHRRGMLLESPVRYRITNGPHTGTTCTLLDVTEE
jgi:hypothetical protein